MRASRDSTSIWKPTSPALENDLGYGVGDWVPYLTVDYAVVGSDGQHRSRGHLHGDERI